MSDYLQELVFSGYVARDYSWSLITGKEKKVFRYRLSDNYLRFYLKYIEPNYNKIQRDQFVLTSLTSLPGFNTIMGYQVENMVLNNRASIYRLLHINPQDIVYDNPYYQRKTERMPGCQIDYLIQTRFRTLYVCEVKFTYQEVFASVIEEMKHKLSCFRYPRGFACLPVLIHVGEISNSIETADYFVQSIDFGLLFT